MDGFGFTDSEWRNVRLTPWIAATAIIDTDGGGLFSTRKELDAVTRHIETARNNSAHQDLVKAIARDLTNDPAMGPLTTPESTADWRVQLRAALDIVDAKAPGAPNRDLREWLYQIASDVADAARDDHHLRGPRVSEAEQSILNEMSSILGVG